MSQGYARRCLSLLSFFNYTTLVLSAFVWLIYSMENMIYVLLLDPNTHTQHTTRRKELNKLLVPVT